MAMSLRKRAQLKSHVASGSVEDANALGEMLHRSRKTSRSKNLKSRHIQYLETRTATFDSDIDGSMRLAPNEQRIIYRTRCPCELHYDKELLQSRYDLNVDTLFDFIFGANEFVQTYRQAQRFYDDTATEWARNEETNCRERTVTYKVPYESTFIGKGTISTREKQIVRNEASGSHYVIDTEVFNGGIKFSDAFSLYMRFCMVQLSATTTNLCVTAQVRFVKPVNALIKQIIERNAYSASQEGLKDLNNRLNLISNFRTEKRRASSRGDALANALPPTIQPSYQTDSYDTSNISHAAQNDRSTIKN